MARRQQAYDLNKQVRLLDIHRQFMGGLKTIDTDDALGSAYLRDVDNLSISEFGFLEKRYGTYVNDEFQFSEAVDFTAVIQGYFEYTDDNGGTHKLLFVGGKAYIKMPSDTLFYPITSYDTEEGFEYPESFEIIEESGWTPVSFSTPRLRKTVSATLQYELGVPEHIIKSLLVEPQFTLSHKLIKFENIVENYENEFKANLEYSLQDQSNFTKSLTKTFAANLEYTLQEFENFVKISSSQISVSFNYELSPIESLAITENVNKEISTDLEFTLAEAETILKSSSKDLVISLAYELSSQESPSPTENVNRNIGANLAYELSSQESPSFTEESFRTFAAVLSYSLNSLESLTLTENVNRNIGANLDFDLVSVDTPPPNFNETSSKTISSSLNYNLQDEEETILEPVFVEITENNDCLWTRVRISNPNTSLANLYFRRSGGDWKLMGSLGAEGDSVFTFSDSSGAPFSTRTYDMKFEISNIGESDVAQFSVTKQSCTFGSVPGDAVAL